ncbi:uncharacterized protein BCR38DRAFT_75647 [Pseudomassariella vexata]|uniref:N-acetyltransferase domain-containing protein n=1 Tax=Pseudomassariella vexata TaxID=1141098 RepID=A0A1Y2DH47_9PEZI|nr:uncharacterized protein BCR38DRAFT_75647 [Pseudomassariella vexata]ORY58055.1 hypothetical protein BCR38DRAFT_75647 [Pseudomassariella vexata]
MAQSVSATITGPNGPLDIVLGEQTPDQKSPCWELAVAAFAPQIPASAFAEQAEALWKHPLARNQGVRFWCISLADDPASVVAMCGTIRRPLLVRDSESTREEDGYCVFMVATHAQYRRRGLAKILLKRIAEWLDGPGDAAASMLYTSVGDFYVSMGWEMIPSIVSTITYPSGAFPANDQTSLPNSRLLSNAEIPELCNRDVADLKDNFEKATVGAEEVHLAVLPTPDMITYLHEWGDVLTLKTLGKTPQVHGAICEAADTWIYWHHSVEKILITRVRTPPKSSQGSSEALVSLLLHALEEARKWGFPKVTAWEPSSELLSALEFIKKNFGIEVQTGQRPNSITSVRWKGSDQTKKTILHLNESYAAS